MGAFTVGAVVRIPFPYADFSHGNLQVDSYIRPDKLFIVEQTIIERSVGEFKTLKNDRSQDKHPKVICLKIKQKRGFFMSLTSSAT